MMPSELWPIRAVLLAGAILLLGRLIVAVCRQPARRVWVGVVTVFASLLVIPLCMLPGWLPVTVAVTHSDVPVPPAAIPELPQDRVETNFVVLFPTEHPPVSNTIAQPGRGIAEIPAVASEVAIPPEPSPASSIGTQPPAEAFDGRGWFQTGCWIYGMVVIGLLARLFAGHLALLRLWRMAHSAPAWVDATFRPLASELCPTAQLRVSTRVDGPVCFGIVRPRVLIPESLVISGGSRALRCVFAHELSHLRRRDPLTGWLLGLARSLYFFWPWVGGLRREVRLAQEYLADAAAVGLAEGPADYAELLIRLTKPRNAPLGAAGVKGTTSDLFRRVTMLLKKPGRFEERCPRRWAMTFGIALTSLAIVATGLYIQPRAVAADDNKAPEQKKPSKDPVKEAIEKLKKDAGADPEVLKKLEEMLKALEQPKPVAPPRLPPAPPLAPGIAIPPGIEGFEQMLQAQQEMMQKMMEQMRGRGAFGGGVMVGPNGLQPFGFGGMGGGRLGVRVEKPSDVLASQLDLPSGKGLVCVDVPVDSTAGKAGVKPHDILLEVGGKPVSSDVMEFTKAIKTVKADEKVDIVVLRKGKKETIKAVTIPEAKEPEFPGFNGFQNFPGIKGLPIPPIDDGTPLPLPPGTPGKSVTVQAGPGEKIRIDQVNDAFTVFYQKDGTKVTIAGSKDADGKAKADSIEVEANGKTVKAESIEKLPKEFQDLAKKALGTIK